MHKIKPKRNTLGFYILEKKLFFIYGKMTDRKGVRRWGVVRVCKLKEFSTLSISQQAGGRKGVIFLYFLLSFPLLLGY